MKIKNKIKLLLQICFIIVITLFVVIIKEDIKSSTLDKISIEECKKEQVNTIKLEVIDEKPPVTTAFEEAESLPPPTNNEISIPQDSEYPVAYEIWLFLIENGYSKHAAAGIIGNCMAEAGGQTLNIQPNIYGSHRNYYGICQWSKRYYPEVYGKDLKFQLDFLLNTIEGQFRYCGGKFNCTLDELKQADDECFAALKFCQIYERCSSKSHKQRQINATKAYKYFIELESVN